MIIMLILIVIGILLLTLSMRNWIKYQDKEK